MNLSTPEAADAFAAVARRNVREHPLKFMKNWLYNVVRLFLDVPVSVRGTPFWNTYSQAHLLLLGFTAYVVVRARRAALWPAAQFAPPDSRPSTSATAPPRSSARSPPRASRGASRAEPPDRADRPDRAPRPGAGRAARRRAAGRRAGQAARPG